MAVWAKTTTKVVQRTDTFEDRVTEIDGIPYPGRFLLDGYGYEGRDFPMGVPQVQSPYPNPMFGLKDDFSHPAWFSANDLPALWCEGCWLQSGRTALSKPCMRYDHRHYSKVREEYV